MNPLFLILLIATLSLNKKLSAQQKADLIIINGKVTTMDDSNPETEAVAIAGNKFILTGSNTAVLKLKQKATRVIDAKGRRVIPGLFDSHLHVIRGGRFYNAELRWDGVASLKRALEMLKEQAERTPAGQWVRVVGGWNEYQFEEKRLPTVEEINEATGNVPAFILYLYGKAWLNKAGMDQLNINPETVSPAGGLVEKDKYGNPTGLLRAEPNAFILYSTLAKLPELSQEEKINSTLQYMRELNRLGVTAVMDAGGGFQNYPDDYSITDSLHRAGKLTVRIPYFLFAQQRGKELADYSNWITMVDIHHHQNNGINEVDYHIQGAGENLVAEAADFENFLYPRPELPPTMEANLKAVLQLLVKKRWPFRIHATYNESITRDLNVLEEINKEMPLGDLVWMIDHAETISAENMKRIKELGGGIAIQHRMAYQGESFIRRYGKKAALDAPPVKQMLAMGIPVALGTDGTRVASYNPWVALKWITTGKTIGGVQTMAKENTLDRYTALRLMTAGGYSLIKENNSKGKIKRGYYADLVILNQDYFSIPDEAIANLSSLLTIVDGKVVYGAKEYGTLAPAISPALPAWSPVNFYGGYQYDTVYKSKESRISFGGEYRFQFQYFKNEDWGEAPQKEYTAPYHRLRLHGDLQIGKTIRGFGQLVSTTVAGKEIIRSVDENRLDVSQLYLDFKLMKSMPALNLRVGRQELLYGSQRLISVREGPNNRLSFDAVKASFKKSPTQIDLFLAYPVRNRPGVFDDRFNKSTHIWSVYVVKNQVPLFQNLDIYYIGFENKNRVAHSLTTPELRHSVGLRFWGNTRAFQYDIELVYQGGKKEEEKISAYTASANCSYHFKTISLHPKVGLKTELISGDKSPADNKTGTFNPLFPRGAYFGLAALIGPVNLIDLHPSIEVELLPKLSFTADYDIFWRYSIADGLYGADAALLFPAAPGKHIGNQLGLTVEYIPMEKLNVVAELTYFKSGHYLKAVSRGENIVFSAITVQVKI